MSSIRPLVVEIPLDKKAIAKKGNNPFAYIQEVLEKIYKDNNLPMKKKIKDVRYKRILESKGMRGNTVLYEIRYEHNAKVGNTSGNIETKEHGFGI